jgi:tetratricopeptide (TPR) repeat protein
MQRVSDVISEAERLESQGRTAEALARWKEASNATERPDVAARLGRAYLLAGFLEDGERTLLAAVSKNPTHPDAHFFLGFHYHTRGAASTVQIRARSTHWRRLRIESALDLDKRAYQAS